MTRWGWLVLVALAGTARADNVSEAIALFEKGQQLFDAGQIDQACEAFDASVRLDPQLGAKLNLGNCRESQQRYAAAHQLYEEVAAEAARLGKTGRETFAKQRLEAIKSKVARYKLAVRVPAPGLAIKQIQNTTVDIPPTEWSTTRIANAGSIRFEVTAPARVTQQVERQLTGDTEIEIEIPALAEQAIVVPDRPRPPVDKPVVVTHKRSRLPLVIGGIGVGLVAACLGTGLQAKLRYDDAFEAGSQKGIDDARGEAGFSTLLGMAGVVAITTAIVLRVRQKPDRTLITPTAAPSTVGIAAFRTF